MCMPYEMKGEIKAAYPDFIIVRNDSVLGYVIDILEPHDCFWQRKIVFADNIAVCYNIIILFPAFFRLPDNITTILIIQFMKFLFCISVQICNTVADI